MLFFFFRLLSTIIKCQPNIFLFNFFAMYLTACIFSMLNMPILTVFVCHSLIYVSFLNMHAMRCTTPKFLVFHFLHTLSHFPMMPM